MDANQLIKALGDAATAAKPPQEYCFLWIDWWATCMTKAEWSGWMQAIGSAIALLIAVAIPYLQTRHVHVKNYEMAKQCLTHALGVYFAIRTQSGLMGSGVAALHVSKTTLDTLVASLREVKASDLPQGSHSTWFPAVASIEQFKARADAVGTPALPAERIDEFIEGYVKLGEDYLRAFVKYAPRKFAWGRRH